MAQMVEIIDPGVSFSLYRNAKVKTGLQAFHSLHHSMFQNIVSLESYKILVFKNMQTICCSILWQIRNIIACCILVRSIHDIQATIRNHIRLSIAVIS